MRILSGKLATVSACCALVLAASAASGSPEDGSLGGYVQVRYDNEQGGAGAFAVRRMKVWKRGAVSGAAGWFYKLQVETDTRHQALPHVQDAFGEYRADRWRVRFGQLVPEFTLERSQPDHVLPVLERAAVVNAAHPGAETDCRDIGVALTVDPVLGHGHLTLGLFNGTGANRLAGSVSAGMFVGRLLWRGHWGSQNAWHVGLSAMRRRAHELRFLKLLGSSRPFSGLDRRIGVEGQCRCAALSVQGEFLEARLGRWQARGAYGLATWALGKRGQLVGYAETFDRPGTLRREAGMGYVWQVPRNRVRLWLFAATRWLKERHTWLSAQVQVMFN